jgi:CRP/FNR family cyclic AMP-dependent transcriptional regulator
MQLPKRSRVDLLRSVWLFEACSQRELDQLATVTAVRAVTSGHYLSREGDQHREFIVIVDGKAEVTRQHQNIAILGPGDFIGEMSLLDRKERVATVTALTPTTLLVMTGANFDMILRDHPSFARNVLTVVSRRLRDLETRFITREPPELGD